MGALGRVVSEDVGSAERSTRVDRSDQPGPTRTEGASRAKPERCLLDGGERLGSGLEHRVGQRGEPAFFAATCWPSVLVTKPRYDFTSSACLASLNEVQVTAYETSGMG